MYAIRYLYASGSGDALNTISLLSLMNKDNISKSNLMLKLSWCSFAPLRWGEILSNTISRVPFILRWFCFSSFIFSYHNIDIISNLKLFFPRANGVEFNGYRFGDGLLGRFGVIPSTCLHVRRMKNTPTPSGWLLLTRRSLEQCNGKTLLPPFK